jgi:hypothetical protein
VPRQVLAAMTLGVPPDAICRRGIRCFRRGRHHANRRRASELQFARGYQKSRFQWWIELRPGHTAVGVSYWKNEKKKHSRGLVKGGLNAFDTLYDS